MRRVKYASFFENSREGYMLLENGKIMDCNDAAVSMFGYELKQDLIGHIPFDISLTKQAQWSSPK